MKKIISFFVITIMIIINCNSLVLATEGDNIDSNWVGDAFKATGIFLNEETKDTIGISPIFETFQGIVKGINRILIIALAGISIISLSITGVRYIASGASPNQREVAHQSLRTAFIGMAFGFGAYVIWRIAMGIVAIIIGSF